MVTALSIRSNVCPCLPRLFWTRSCQFFFDLRWLDFGFHGYTIQIEGIVTQVNFAVPFYRTGNYARRFEQGGILESCEYAFVQIRLQIKNSLFAIFKSKQKAVIVFWLNFFNVRIHFILLQWVNFENFFAINR